MSAAITNGEIREALAQAVGQVPGINVYRYPPDNVTVPCVMISGLSMKPITFDGNRETTIDVIVLVSRRSVDQMAGLDQLLDADDRGVFVARRVACFHQVERDLART